MQLSPDIPFDTFGEGSFDKAIYAAFPLIGLFRHPIVQKTFNAATYHETVAHKLCTAALPRNFKFSNASVKREFGGLEMNKSLIGLVLFYPCLLL